MRSCDAPRTATTAWHAPIGEQCRVLGLALRRLVFSSDVLTGRGSTDLPIYSVNLAAQLPPTTWLID